MPLQQALTDFGSSIAQCNSLIANAHKVDANGASIFPLIDRQQITCAAFLNLFIAWETFLESTITALMTGAPTVSGTAPVRYIVPATLSAAHEMIKGNMRFFDYSNHQHVRQTVNLYFENGYPFEPHLSAIYSDLDDLKTMRNGSAHISTTTQTAIESLALRIFGSPRVGITLYQMLTAVYPRSATGETILLVYQEKLKVTAELISQG